MIASLTGKLEGRVADCAIIGVGGVGFKVHVPATVLARLGAIGEPVSLLTVMYVREDQLSLYGFATEDQRHMFELLLTISGIGPKAGLAILSSVSLEVLQVAIATGNAEPLTAIPGIGKKMAARIALELKGKFAPRDAVTQVATTMNGDAELLAALTGLGYTAGEAEEAMRALPEGTGTTVEERLTATLRYFATR